MTYKDDFARCAAATKTDNHGRTTPDMIIDKRSSYAICLYYSNEPTVTYDFLNRMMITMSSVGIKIVLFQDLDREILEAMRDKLIELGGTPPALPETGLRPDTKINKTHKPRELND